MRIASWNVNSLRVRLEHLERFVAEADPDVLCLQETKCADARFPAEAVEALGFPHQATWGEKTYNGVAILAKEPLEEVQRGFASGPPDPQPRLLGATVGGVRILDCYVPNGSPLGSSKFTYKLAWLSRLKREVRALEGQPLLVCGDMNVALEDRDVWDPFEADGKVLFTHAERDALRRVLAAGLVDPWRATHPEATEFTWWDYRGAGFQRNHGLRIDYAFVSPDLAERVTEARHWPETRRWKQPSDHCPVTVDLGD